jgi:hypothetical protein
MLSSLPCISGRLYVYIPIIDEWGKIQIQIQTQKKQAPHFSQDNPIDRCYLMKSVMLFLR